MLLGLSRPLLKYEAQIEDRAVDGAKWHGAESTITFFTPNTKFLFNIKTFYFFIF